MLAPTPVFAPVLLPVSVKVENSNWFDGGAGPVIFGGRRNSNQQIALKYRPFPSHLPAFPAQTLSNQAPAAYQDAVS
jgi:hypothetical protein